MRAYSVIFSDNRTGYKCRFGTDKDGFRRMRRYIFQAENGLGPCWQFRMANVCDDIQDLEIGKTMYVISSPWEVYVADSIENFNRMVERMDRACRGDYLKEYGEAYMPNPSKAFKIKRTPHFWQFASLEYDMK